MCLSFAHREPKRSERLSAGPEPVALRRHTTAARPQKRDSETPLRAYFSTRPSSNLIDAWLPSQNGLFEEAPQRHSVMRFRFS
jgi:hypothetical protein